MNPEKGVERFLRAPSPGSLSRWNPEKGVESGILDAINDVNVENPEKGVESRYDARNRKFFGNESRKGS